MPRNVPSAEGMDERGPRGTRDGAARHALRDVGARAARLFFAITAERNGPR